jgi:hypothetical protein
MKSTATIPTAHGAKYMVQLCKHFAHRVPATHAGREGRITFEAGTVGLRAAPETLMLWAEGVGPADLDSLEQVVGSHLKRFAFREPELAVDWSRAPEISPSASG